MNGYMCFILISIIIILPAGAREENIMLGPYNISFDTGVEDLTWTEMAPIESGTLSGSSYTQYGMDGNNKEDSTTLSLIIYKYRQISEKNLALDEALAAFKEMGFKIDTFDRQIDNHSGTMISGYNATLNSQVYAAVWQMDNTTQCSIFSHYPWDMGTLQLVKSIHIEHLTNIPYDDISLGSIMLGPYNINYDILLDSLNQNKLGPLESETLSGIPYIQYGLNGTSQDGLEVALRINKYDRPWDFKANSSVEGTLEKLGCTDLNVADRKIDGCSGAIGEGTDAQKTALIYAAAWKINNATECSILSNYPWDEGTRQLLDTVHVEYRPEYTDIGTEKFVWTSDNFSGFYYDPDQGISTELLEFRLSNISFDKSTATLSDQMEPDGYGGIFYMTAAKEKDFSYKPWGSYYVIGFLGEKHVAAYDPVVTEGMVKANENDPFLYAKSISKDLISSSRISSVLIDNGSENSITIGDKSPTLNLKEGYQLTIKSVDMDGNKVFLELTKNGEVVDSKAISRNIEDIRVNDKTYYYKKDLGETKGIVIIAVHFKDISGSSTPLTWKATIDGIFQMSDTPTEIKDDKEYGIMSVRKVDPNYMTITMDNRGHQIDLSKNRNIPMLPKIYIKTLNQEIIDADHPLIYGIYPHISRARLGPALIIPRFDVIIPRFDTNFFRSEKLKDLKIKLLAANPV